MKQRFLYGLMALLLLGAVGCKDKGLDQEPDPSIEENYPGLQFRISADAPSIYYLNEEGSTPAVAGKATTDTSLTTTFNFGDEIGVFAIYQEGDQAGEIAVGFNNTKFTKIKGSGELWRPSKLTFQPREKVKYFLYYPYKDNMADCLYVEPLGTPDGKSVLETWMAKDNYSTNQADTTKFTAQDLMTCNEVVVDEDQDTFTAELKHRMTMVELSFRDQTGKYDEAEVINPDWKAETDGIQYQPDFFNIEAKNKAVLKRTGIADAQVEPLKHAQGFYRFLVPGSVLSPSVKAQIYVPYTDAHGNKMYTTVEFDPIEGTVQKVFPELRQVTVVGKTGDGKGGADPVITSSFMIKPTLARGQVLEIDPASDINNWNARTAGIPVAYNVRPNLVVADDTEWEARILWVQDFDNTATATRRAPIAFKQSGGGKVDYRSEVTPEGVAHWIKGKGKEKLRLQIQAMDFQGTAQITIHHAGCTTESNAIQGVWLYTIWFSDFDEATDVCNFGGNKLMDREMGALGEGDSQKLYYQWGSPVGHRLNTAKNAVASTMTSSRSLWVVLQVGSFISTSSAIDILTENQDQLGGTFGYNRWGANNNSWTTTFTAGKGNKTLFDPCPAGWRVPYEYNLSSGTAYYVATSNAYGYRYYYAPQAGYVAPIGGLVDYSSGAIGNNTGSALYNYIGSSFAVNSGLTISSSSATAMLRVGADINKSFGASVRCTKDE